MALSGGQRRDIAPLPIGNYGYGTDIRTQDLSLSLVWRVASEWRWLILAAFGVGIAAAVLITLLTPLKYRSTAVVELNPPQMAVLDQAGGEGGGARATAQASDLSFVGTQIGLLGSQALSERVAQDLNLAANPAVVGDPPPSRDIAQRIATNYVRGGLTTKTAPASRLVTINFVSLDPALAARIVNGVADAYINTNLERRYQSSSYARDFLQRQIVIVRRELERSERDLVAYAQRERLISTGGGGASEQAGDTNSLAGNSLVALNGALSQTIARRIAAEQRYREAMTSGSTTETSATAAPLRGQIAALNAEYEQKLQTFRPDYPEMVALKARIDALRASVVTETRTAGSDRAGSLRQEFQAARAEEARLRQQVAGLSSSVLDQRGRRIQYNILQRGVDTNRAQYDALLQRFKEIGVSSGIGTAVASVVDRGTVPAGPYAPSLFFNVLIGAAVGLLSGLLAAMALEFINDTIKSPTDVRDKLGLPFLGGIPVAKDKPMAELKDPLSPVTEAYLSTATALQFLTEAGAPKTMLVTSTRPAEGKSTTAWALAQSYARLGHSVLLIDADMRRPAFVTGQDDVGLSHILTKTDALSEHILKTDVDQLWMIPAGPTPPSPPELLASPRFASLLAEASSMFDLVVLDGPPILGLADAPLLATTVEGTLMVIEAGRTRTRAAVEAFNRLRTSGSHVMGAILTRYQAQASYGYGYGYGYGQKQGEYRYVADDESKRRRILLTVSRDKE
ncbi:polysaccharide biosynthesis tyrosine autokinase [Sphingomonas sp.]|uniref:GumC family protein n=1 Tax=Sphingomonas sp. TaxID=28214 RepID=UPI002D7F4F0F|nr:polysaccharide biosynthesis tyrosine autokinase [Sphingomonas sp.]HEU0044546.1 polysaccharide biosynthesis tyrosine autokinase [Sphingomonas sp.]